MAESAAPNGIEARRQKQTRKMTKIVAKAWAFPKAEPFQQSAIMSDNGAYVYDLASVGQNIDDGVYKLGRQGWEHFSRDIGGVYNHHIERKTKHAKHAKQHRDHVAQMLGKLDASLAALSAEYCPPDVAVEKKGKKRKSVGGGTEPPKKCKPASDKCKLLVDMTPSEREENAMECLRNYIEEVGGSPAQVDGFRSKIVRKGDGRFDKEFFTPEGRRFRSMIEVGRFLNLVEDTKTLPSKMKKVSNKKPSNNRDCENEKKRLRKELDKLLKAHRKATKALDDFQNERKESRYPVEDDILMEEVSASSSHGPLVTPTACPAALVPDIDGFDGAPSHCIPDLLMTWDFLCTFSRALSLNPIDLDDFAAALTFIPVPSGDAIDPSTHIPPVYLAEAHLGLLKLVLTDKSSDGWWWSILEIPETAEGDDGVDDVAATSDITIPLIKVDMAELFDFPEDPLITASWLQSLEEVRNHRSSSGSGPIRRAIKTARGIAANKWVKAYLKKALSADPPSFTKRAVLWLVDRVREARPEIWDRKVSKEEALEKKRKVIVEVAALMEMMHESEARIGIDDVEGDGESDDESDDSDDENGADPNHAQPSNAGNEAEDENAPATTAIPTKPPPSIVDLLLPPAKPLTGSDLVNSFTWPALTGATVCRILHRYKRLRNEVDDSLRAFNELEVMTKAERHRREEAFASRVFTECAVSENDESPSEKAATFLSSGGSYLELNPVERLCLLRVLIEGAYDTRRVYEVVDDNFQARIGAVKALEMEKRRAKREAREEMATAEKAAREKLASEAKSKFLSDKRQEIIESNKRTNEYTDDFIESLTEEDIMEFDEEVKAEFDALPGPESFNKSEVNVMVARMQEEAAFNTDSLTFLTMEEILEREKKELEAMEEELRSFGDIDEFEMNREMRKHVDRLRRNIDEAKDLALSLPEIREEAEAALKDAMQDGTIKVVRAAIRLAKQANLTGDEDMTDGVWALDLLRDAALELKSAEGRKRVIEAQKDLVAKRNKCFIRTEPIGRDRFRNRFWQFDNSERGHVWTEVDYVLNNDSNVDKIMGATDSRFVDLAANESTVAIGAEEKEEDFVNPSRSPEEKAKFVHFSRQEYHRSGVVPALTKRHWGCQTTEASWRAMIKSLDERGSRERTLKENLKEALEESKQEDAKDGPGDTEKGNDAEYMNSGDEHVFLAAKHSVHTNESTMISLDLLQGLSSALGQKVTSALGQKVRIRELVDSSKDNEMAHYLLAVVDGWKMIDVEEAIDVEESTDQDDSGGQAKNVSTVPVWRATLDRGGEMWLPGLELLDSMCRFIRWSRKDKGYFEDDAAFLAYRNSLGRHCGKAAEAAVSSTPAFLARLMVKREQELYMPLKNRSYDNNWGGKSSARNAWVDSMRDFCFDLNTARNGLLTLENAFFELTGGITEDPSDPQPDGKSLLSDETSRSSIELESIGKSVNSLWNSRESRAVFREIVHTSKTTGVLALALELLSRNCRAYLDANKLSEPRKSFAAPTPFRMTRRMNAWQQKAEDSWYD